MGETVVRCGQCLLTLAEPPNTPLEDRKPCPNCGATNRNYAVTVGMAVEVDVALSVSPQTAPIVGNLDDAGFSVLWIQLSEGGAWMVRVYDEAGIYIDGAVADDPADAILAVAERLLPSGPQPSS